MSEAELKTIRKAAAGDRMAFRELVLEHSPALFRLAWRLTGDQALADDVVQDTLIKAWNKLGSFKMESSFHTWLHRITVNTAMDHLRKRSRQQQFETEEPDWEGLPQAAEAPRHDVQIDIQRETAAALGGLSETERAALMLRHFEGHSIKEIAEMLEITTDACKQAIFRAVQKMRTALQPLVTA